MGRAALPLVLQLPRRCLQPRRTGRRGRAARPVGAGHHRSRRHVRSAPVRAVSRPAETAGRRRGSARCSAPSSAWDWMAGAVPARRYTVASPPVHGASPPGHGASPPVHGAIPPGHGASPPRHGASPPGHGAISAGRGAAGGHRACGAGNSPRGGARSGRASPAGARPRPGRVPAAVRSYQHGAAGRRREGAPPLRPGIPRAAHGGHWVILTGCRKGAVPAALAAGGARGGRGASSLR